MISGFRRAVDEIFTLLGYYAGYIGNSLPTFRNNLSVPSSRAALEDGTDRLSRNISRELATTMRCVYPRRVQILAEDLLAFQEGLCSMELVYGFHLKG